MSQSAQDRVSKMMRKIMVIPTDIVYKDHIFEGFVTKQEADLEQTILDNYEYQVRGPMESNQSFQQPLPYAIVVNPTTQKIIAYKRGSSESTSGEKRLYGKRSLGVGGHIEREEQHAENPMNATVLKEIEEEIGIESITNYEILGYINDNSDEVGKYHLAVLYVAYTDEEDAAIGDGELEEVYFKTVEEIDELMNDENIIVESWSRIARQAYKDLYVVDAE